MEPLFKVGDTVVIAPRDGDGDCYRFSYVDEMLEYSGKTAVITKITKSRLGGDYSKEAPDDGYEYKIDLDGGVFFWASSMFNAPIAKKESTSEIKIHIKRDRKIKFNFKN